MVTLPYNISIVRVVTGCVHVHGNAIKLRALLPLVAGAVALDGVVERAVVVRVLD